MFPLLLIHCPGPMKITVQHASDQGPHLHLQGAIVHSDTDPEALGQDKPALTVLVIMDHFHELTINIDLVRYAFLVLFATVAVLCHYSKHFVFFQTQQPRRSPEDYDPVYPTTVSPPR